MKKIIFLSLLCTLVLTTRANPGDPGDLTEGFVLGDPKIKSINALSFGPQGILFIGDSRSAAVFAVETASSASATDPVAMSNVDQKIAEALGTSADQISIQDLAVHPQTGKVYLAVHHANGTPVLLTVEGESFAPVDLRQIRYSLASIEKVVAEDAKDSRGRDLRVWTISDLGYYNGEVMITGLSNQEFSSTFRSIPFPFKNEEETSSLEIYHASHGKYETHSPIKTFTATELGGSPYLIASYTCTPLVVFPLNEMKPGQHVKGRTVAELGNRNTPLDMVTMKKGNESYLLLANSSRSLMRISYKDISDFKDSLSEPVENTGGVEFVALPYVNVLQLDKLNDTHMVMLQRKADGNLDLMTVETNRL